jgi:hypothetical protein
MVLQPERAPSGVAAYAPRPTELDGAFSLSYFEMPSERLIRLPPNTSVDVVRSGKASGIEFALVRVVDAGGIAATGTEVIVMTKSLAATSSGPPPAETGRAEREAREARQRGTEEMIAREVKTGRCTDEHAAEMQLVLQRAGRLFESGNGGGKSIVTVLGHKLVVATDQGSSASFGIGIEGEHHIFALGYDRQLKLEVRNAQGYPVTSTSGYADTLESLKFPIRSRTLRANSRQTIDVSVTGQGCTLLFLVRRD